MTSTDYEPDYERLQATTSEFLNWKTHFTILRAKLERSIGLLAKLRYVVTVNLLRTVYFAIFDSYLRYGCQVWGQNKNAGTNEISPRQSSQGNIF